MTQPLQPAEQNAPRPVEFSIIIESYNHAEGGDRDRFRSVVRAALEMMPDDGSGEVLVIDVYESPELARLLADEFPTVRRVAAPGLGYDAAKSLAARVANGEFLLYLDGDCLPDPDWHEQLLAPLRSGKAVACGGYTRYEGGFLAAMQSVMDFGFLSPCVPRDLQCYASNNSGFRRAVWEEVPVPDADLRCRCFIHAQHLLRRGTPVQLVPAAKVSHEFQPLLRERSRQGYDTIAAAWADPELPEARWLRFGMLSLPLFYALNVRNDWKRVRAGRQVLELGRGQMLLSMLLFPVFRLVDAMGMLRAFIRGREEGGWGGIERKAAEPSPC